MSDDPHPDEGIGPPAPSAPTTSAPTTSAPTKSALPKPLAQLWEVETAGHVTRAILYSHPTGFEVRILDAAGEMVETHVFTSEPDAEAFAEQRRQALLSGGMATDPDDTPPIR